MRVLFIIGRLVFSSIGCATKIEESFYKIKRFDKIIFRHFLISQIINKEHFTHKTKHKSPQKHRSITGNVLGYFVYFYPEIGICSDLIGRITGELLDVYFIIINLKIHIYG